MHKNHEAKRTYVNRLLQFEATVPLSDVNIINKVNNHITNTVTLPVSWLLQDITNTIMYTLKTDKGSLQITRWHTHTHNNNLQYHKINTIFATNNINWKQENTTAAGLPCKIHTILLSLTLLCLLRWINMTTHHVKMTVNMSLVMADNVGWFTGPDNGSHQCWPVCHRL